MGLDDLIWLAAEASAAAGGAVALFVTLRSKLFVAVPPNKALVLYGSRSGPASSGTGLPSSEIVVRRPHIVVGGGAYVSPWNRGVAQISLDPLAVDVTVRSVHALEGSHASGWEVRLQLQAKVPAEPAFLAMAAENLLAKSEEDVRSIVRRAVEGVVPAVLARIKPEDGEPEWDRLAAEIQASVAPDLVPWGLVIRTLSVVELRRIAPSDTSISPLRTASVEPLGNPGNLGALLGGLDARMTRTERNLGILGAEVLRMSRRSETPLDVSGPLAAFELPVSGERTTPTDADESADPIPHGSMGGDRSPRFRRQPSGDRSREGDPDPRPPSN